MGGFTLFIIRAMLAAVFAVLIGRFFFQGTPVIKVTLLALVLLGLAYLFEYTKKRDSGGQNGK
ncbi:MAG: hypothetical protein ABII06_09215 [Pseudomonadota bacterium]